MRVWRIGDLIDGQWHVDDIKFGGTANVYIVTNAAGDRLAVKGLRRAARSDSSQLEAGQRFIREAKTWIRLGAHKNIVRAEFYRVIDNTPLLFLEYVTGGPILGPVQNKSLCRDYALQICDAMVYAYSKGVKCHRDIKPHNCLLSTDERIAKLSDFGISGTSSPEVPFEPIDETDGRFEGREWCRTNSLISTKDGIVAGTPAYMPPEQFRGLTNTDTRSDIYAFGIMLFEWFTGQPPFMSNTWDEIKRQHDIVQPPTIDEDSLGTELKNWRHIIAKCLEKDPDDRFQDFESLRSALFRTRPQYVEDLGPIDIPNPYELTQREFLNRFSEELIKRHRPQDSDDEDLDPFARHDAAEPDPLDTKAYSRHLRDQIREKIAGSDSTEPDLLQQMIDLRDVSNWSVAADNDRLARLDLLREFLTSGRPNPDLIRRYMLLEDLEDGDAYTKRKVKHREYWFQHFQDSGQLHEFALFRFFWECERQQGEFGTRMIAPIPPSADSNLKVGKQTGDELYAIAESHLELNVFDQCIKTLRSLVEQHPDCWKAWELMEKVLLKHLDDCIVAFGVGEVAKMLKQCEIARMENEGKSPPSHGAGS